MTYRDHRPRRRRRVLTLMAVAFVLSGGGMWLITQAMMTAAGHGTIPPVMIPIGMVTVGAGHAVAYYTGRVAVTYPVTRVWSTP